MLIYADYACKMGSTSLAREDIFRTQTADKKTICDRQIKAVGGFVERKEQKNKTMAGKFNLIASR